MNLEARKAQLREYIEARERATQGEWKYESGPAFKSKYHCAFVEDIMALESHEGLENEQEGNVRFSCKAANESARIAEQLIECIEALECLKKRWKKVGAEKTTSYLIVDEALNKIAGDK